MSRPLLFLDVDGVISLWGFAPDARPPGVPCNVDGIYHYLSNAAALQILRLAGAFECVWCTGWRDRADEHLPHLLGLPRGWPHLELPREPAADGRHWKLAALERHAGPQRPLAWVDDQFDAGCHAWAAQRDAPTLLLQTHPDTGLQAPHADRLLAWSAAVTR